MIQGRALVAVGIVAVVGLGSTPLGAQPEGEPDPCAHVFGQISLSNCWAREAERANEEMNHAYLALLGKLPERGAKTSGEGSEVVAGIPESPYGNAVRHGQPGGGLRPGLPGVSLNLESVHHTGPNSRAGPAPGGERRHDLPPLREADRSDAPVGGCRRLFL